MCASPVLQVGPQVLDVKLPFDEAALLVDNLPYLKRTLKVRICTWPCCTDVCCDAPPRIMLCSGAVGL